MPEQQVNHPDPQEGGRYVRNRDGSLTQIHATEEAPMRDKRDGEKADKVDKADVAQDDNTRTAGKKE